MFIGRTDTKVQLLWSPAEKSQLIGKDPDAGKDWMREEKGTTEDEMVGWRRRLDGRECEQAPGDGEGQGHEECCRLWGREQSGTTERLASSGDSGCGRVSLVFIRISLLLRLVPLPRQIEPGARPPVCEQQYACYGLRPLFNVGCSLWENPNAIFLQPHGLPGAPGWTCASSGPLSGLPGLSLGHRVSAEERAWGPVLASRGGWPCGLGRLRSECSPSWSPGSDLESGTKKLSTGPQSVQRARVAGLRRALRVALGTQQTLSGAGS